MVTHHPSICDNGRPIDIIGFLGWNRQLMQLYPLVSFFHLRIVILHRIIFDDTSVVLFAACFHVLSIYIPSVFYI